MVSDSDLSPLYLRSWLWLFPEGLPLVYKALALVGRCQSPLEHCKVWFDLFRRRNCGSDARSHFLRWSNWYLIVKHFLPARVLWSLDQILRRKWPGLGQSWINQNFMEIIAWHSLQMDLIMNCVECRDLVLEAIRYHTDVYNQPLEISSQYTPRGHQGIMLISHNSARHQVIWYSYF